MELDWALAGNSNLRCRLWRKATWDYIHADGGLDRNYLSIGVLDPVYASTGVLETSTHRVLTTSSALLDTLHDWSCNNTFSADVALLGLLDGWFQLAQWQLHEVHSIDMRWKDIYIQSMNLVGVAATRMAARRVGNTYEDWNALKGPEMLGVWPLSKEQRALNEQWSAMYRHFERTAAAIGWWARFGENRKHVVDW